MSRPAPNQSAMHALTWLLWALAAAVSLQIASSPVYVVGVIAMSIVVVRLHRRPGAIGRAMPIMFGLGIVFALLKIALTTLTTHGVGDVLFTLPAVTLPKIAGGFTVGGTVELPVILQAASESLVVIGVLSVFGAFNSVVSHHELLQMVPRVFHEIGLVLTVALAFIPSTLAAVAAVREADKARAGGRIVRRGRVVRMIIPVVETGMERAVFLAESMDARGFGRAAPTSKERHVAWATFAALVSVGAAFVALVGRQNLLAFGLTIVAILFLGVAVGVGSKAVHRPRYRRLPIRRPDVVMIGVIALAPLALVALATAADAQLTWAISPLRWPGFDPRIALALLPLSLPLLVPNVREQ